MFYSEAWTDERSVVRTVIASSDHVLFDLVHRMLGQVLVDFGDDPGFHIGREGGPQFRQGTGRRNHNERICLALEAKAFSSACHGAGRAMSRHAAFKRWSGRKIVDDLAAQGILIRSPSMRGVAE